MNERVCAYVCICGSWCVVVRCSVQLSRCSSYFRFNFSIQVNLVFRLGFPQMYYNDCVDCGQQLRIVAAL